VAATHGIIVASERGTTSDERANGNNKQTNQCDHIAVSRLQSHPPLSLSLLRHILFLSFSFVRSLSLVALLLRRGARAQYMGGKKCSERSIQSARKDGICVSAVGDQRIGSSRSAGVSLGHARRESHSSGASFAHPAPPRSSTGSARGFSFSLFRASLAPPPLCDRSIAQVDTSRSGSGACPLLPNGVLYGYSMRGRTTDIDRLITRLRGGPYGSRR